MNQASSPLLQRSRGRPRSQANPQVIDKLLEAAELLFEKHGPLHLTERTIATQAGVNHAMIHYYFGGMDGLLFALMERITAEVSAAFLKLRTDAEWHRHNPTRHLVKVLVDAHYAKPWLARILLSEVTQGHSGTSALYLKRYGPRGQVEIKRVLDRLVELGIYDRKVDTAFAALSLMSIIAAPLSLTRLSGSTGITIDDLRKDRWLDHVADLFDRQLRSNSD